MPALPMTVLIMFTCTAAAASSELRVIGAGQGRTGTESLRLALNALNVGPTYHMSQLYRSARMNPGRMATP